MVLCLGVARATAAQNVVFEWNAIVNDTVLAGSTPPIVTTRYVALVQGSVFDAVNGIERRYDPLHVRPAAPSHASARAAAVQAAYAALVKLYPAQAATLTFKRTASLDAIAAAPGESARAIANGVAWGQEVTDAVFAWHATDGFDPNPAPSFLGANVTGMWRPTLAGASGATPQNATTTPWVLTRPSQFRLPPPPALTSVEYAADFNETKAYGLATSAVRSTDGTALAIFWNGNTTLYWNRIAAQVAGPRGLSLVESAHLFAVLNVAIVDAGIACWDGKYRFVYWRPVTAIHLADTDGNAATDLDDIWTPLLPVTPSHPENPSGHSTLSGAAAFVLQREFGDANGFTVTSPETAPGTTRSFASFSAAVAEIADARVFGGIHFRTACVRGNTLGRNVAGYVLAHSMRSRDDDHGDERER